MSRTTCGFPHLLHPDGKKSSKVRKKLKINSRGFLEISFAWLFAIIAGAIILAIAIFAATKVINLGQTATSAEAQNQIAVLLNPLETSFQSGQITSISVSTPTRIYNQCDQTGIFGNQIISTSQKSFGKWSVPASGAAFQNKYIFSNSVVEGQIFYLFSKPFDFPFKVSDVIYMTSSDTRYCFVSPPENILDELSKLKEKNFIIENETNLCGGAVKICFNGEGCDVNVDYTKGIVSKGTNSSVNFYGDALMYAAIFSDKGIYECQLKRLMGRETQLSSLYIDKANTIDQIGCATTLVPDLTQLNNLAGSFKNSVDLNNLIPTANKLQQDNDQAICKL